jgi:hypothetical protein
MSIKQLGHNKFQIRVYVGRDLITKKRVNKVLTFYGTEEQAIRCEKRLKAQVKANKSTNPSRIKLNDLIELYFKEARTKLAPRTFYIMRQSLSLWVSPQIGHITLKNLSTKLLQSHFDYLSAPKEPAP